MSNNSDPQLKGILGFPEALATAIGLIIAAAVLLTATQGFGAAGGTFAIAIVIAYVIMMCQSTSFAELAGILPVSGAVYDYVAAGLGRFAGIMATIAAYLLVHVFAGSAETISAGVFAQVNFPFLESVPYWIIGSAAVLVFMAVNLVGIDVFGRVELFMTAFMWITLMIFGILGVVRAPEVELVGFFGESAIGDGPGVVIAMVGLAMFLFVGVEYVTPLAPELKNPNRDIPRSLFIGVTMVAIAMFIYGAAVTRQVPNEVLDPDSGLTLFDTPLPIPIFAETVMGGFGRVWLGIAVFLASCATINTLIAGIPRILYGMAKDGSLPGLFGRLNPRYKTPWNGIFFTAAIPILGTLYVFNRFGADGGAGIDGIITLILGGVCAWIFSYILVNISVITLRMRHPELERPYRTPLYPVPQIIASIGMIITLLNIAPPGIPSSAIYIPFVIMLAISAVIAFIYSRGRAEGPFTPIHPQELLALSESNGDH